MILPQETPSPKSADTVPPHSLKSNAFPNVLLWTPLNVAAPGIIKSTIRNDLAGGARWQGRDMTKQWNGNFAV